MVQQLIYICDLSTARRHPEGDNVSGTPLECETPIFAKLGCKNVGEGGENCLTHNCMQIIVAVLSKMTASGLPYLVIATLREGTRSGVAWARVGDCDAARGGEEWGGGGEGW